MTPNMDRAIDRTVRMDRSVLTLGYFISSEFVFFAFLILAYVDFQHAAISAGPTAAKFLHPGTMAIYTRY